VGAVCFYISGHGFGHASRQIEIINALGAASPATPLLIRTSAPAWLFERTLRVPARLLPGECDTGVVQLDSLHPDIPATISRAGAFHAALPERAAEEAAMLIEHRTALVVSDAPPLASAAAAAASVPSVVVSNFTWDWIYEHYTPEIAQAPALVDTLREAYAHAAEGWRLPMYGGFETFRAVRDVPFVARHARRSAAEVRRACGLREDVPLVLVSFGGYGVRDVALSRLDCLGHYGVVVTSGERLDGTLPEGVAALYEPAIYDAGLRYEDLVAAVDVVLTKPGYGIISECVANDTALLYTSRGRFAEYEVLVQAMPRVLRCSYIAQADLLAGQWLAALDATLNASRPAVRPATNGAEVIAGMIIERL
jgi:L-arabinokinase